MRNPLIFGRGQIGTPPIVAEFPAELPQMQQFQEPTGKARFTSPQFVAALRAFAQTDTLNKPGLSGLADALGNAAGGAEQESQRQRQALQAKHAAAMQQAMAQARIASQRIAAQQAAERIENERQLMAADAEHRAAAQEMAERRFGLDERDLEQRGNIAAERLAMDRDEYGLRRRQLQAQIAAASAPKPQFKLQEVDGVMYRVALDGSRMEPVTVAGANGQAQPVSGTNWKRSRDIIGTFDAKTKDLRRVEPYFRNVLSAAYLGDPNNVDDIALVFNFMKMQDPTSVVMSGERVMVENAKPYSDFALSLVNRLEGEGGLTPKLRAQLVEEARNAYDSNQQRYNTEVETALKRAEAGSVPRDLLQLEPLPAGDDVISEIQARAPATRRSVPVEPELQAVGRGAAAGNAQAAEALAKRYGLPSRQAAKPAPAAAPQSTNRTHQALAAMTPESVAAMTPGARSRWESLARRIVADPNAPPDAKAGAQLLLGG